MAATHFAAINANVVVGLRSSTSRHAEGTGRFGLYTHAILRQTRTTVKQADGSESVTWSEDVISWHGGAANAADGLRAAHVGQSHYYGADHSSYIEDKTVRHGVRLITAAEAVRTITYMRAQVVEVIVTPKKAKLGAAVQR